MAEPFERRYPDQYLLRLPAGLRERVLQQARKNRRSMNAELVDLLEQMYPDLNSVDAISEEILSLSKAISERPENPEVLSNLRQAVAKLRDFISEWSEESE